MAVMMAGSTWLNLLLNPVLSCPIVAQACLSVSGLLEVCWDLQCSRSHAYPREADQKTDTSLGPVTLDTTDHACFHPIPGAGIKQPTLGCTTGSERWQGSWRPSILITET